MSRKVFITGVTGYLGSAIAARIARTGCEVFGLTRDANRAAALSAAGIVPVVGDLASPATYLGFLKNCDAAIHTALDRERASGADQVMLEAFKDAAEDGRLRRVLYTSSLWVYPDAPTETVDEKTPADPLPIATWRAAHEEVALDLVDHEVDVVVMRPGMVYGGSRGYVGALFAAARDGREVTWPGEGDQPWPMVHRDDVAEAYRLGLEYANGGERYILVEESHPTARQVAEAVAAVAGTIAHRLDAEEVCARLGAFGEALLTGRRASAAKARRELGWVPQHSAFLAEIDQLHREWQSGQETPVG